MPSELCMVWSYLNLISAIHCVCVYFVLFLHIFLSHFLFFSSLFFTFSLSFSLLLCAAARNELCFLHLFSYSVGWTQPNPSYADTSTTNRIIPLVHPSILQITSRGRVVFRILPSGQMNSMNSITSYISFLPPEYLNNIGKKITFIESDVEKVRLSQQFILTNHWKEIWSM